MEDGCRGSASGRNHGVSRGLIGHLAILRRYVSSVEAHVASLPPAELAANIQQILKESNSGKQLSIRLYFLIVYSLASF